MAPAFFVKSHYITSRGSILVEIIFQLHAIDAQGHVVFRRRVSRNRLLEFVACCPT
jgi:hypothetical protein